jgi:hypothetical protein
MSHRQALSATLLIALILTAAACRWQSSNPTDVSTGEFGSGSGTFTAQCSGDFPDWISDHPPIAMGGDVNPQEPGAQSAFQLAQAFPLGVPVFGPDGKVAHWDPPAANQDAPWRAFGNLSDAAQRNSYLAALKNYVLEGMSDPSIAFDATRNNSSSLKKRLWFHVPMMTAAGSRRREPYHGVTAERALRPSEQTHWLTAGSNLKAVAIGYYNSLGGYTIGRVFKSYDLSKTDPNQGKFIDGTLVFKLLFAQYVPARIKSPDPLAHSPAWFVQDPSNPGGPLMEVRLLQVDVAVKDDHLSSTTGWAFATFVYDESLFPGEPNAWRRLTPLGIQWGNDPSVTGTVLAALNETWINGSMPAAFKDHLGRAGRLIGPIDNPASSCMSCHSTAEVDMSKVGQATDFLGAAMIPPSPCSDPMNWFRNLPSGPGGSQAFGHAVSSCPVNTSTAGLTSLDYSLQLQEGLQSVFGYQNANPCFDFAKQHHDSVGDAEASNAMAMTMAADKQPLRIQSAQSRRVKLRRGRLLSPAPDELHRR